MERPSEHVEHIEHQQHAAHSPFDRRVAMTMAIVASVLACVTMLSHRAHNATLRLQAEANVLQTEAGILQSEANMYQSEANTLGTEASINHTKASDHWAWYQAKKGRSAQDEANVALARALPVDPEKTKEREKIVKKWEDRIARYKEELPELKTKAEKYDQEAARLQAEAKKKQALVPAKQALVPAKQALVPTKLEESETAHHRGDRFDISELAVELALVLCSIAILTKQRGFWFAGIVSGLVGLAVATSVLFLHGSGH